MRPLQLTRLSLFLVGLFTACTAAHDDAGTDAAGANDDGVSGDGIADTDGVTPPASQVTTVTVHTDESRRLRFWSIVVRTYTACLPSGERCASLIDSKAK